MRHRGRTEDADRRPRGFQRDFGRPGKVRAGPRPMGPRPPSPPPQFPRRPTAGGGSGQIPMRQWKGSWRPGQLRLLPNPIPGPRRLSKPRPRKPRPQARRLKPCRSGLWPAADPSGLSPWSVRFLFGENRIKSTPQSQAHLRLLGLCKAEVNNIRAAAGETRLAVGQVVAPESVEALVEAQGDDLRPGRLETFSPAA